MASEQIRETLKPGDQDWEALLNEQEKFLAEGRASAKVYRKSPPSINGKSEKQPKTLNESLNNSNKPSPSENLAKAETKTCETPDEPSATNIGPFRSTKIIDRHSNSNGASTVSKLKPMLAPMPMKFGKAFPAAVHRSMGGPKLGRVTNPIPEMKATSNKKGNVMNVQHRDNKSGGESTSLSAMLNEISQSNKDKVSQMTAKEVEAELLELQGMFSEESLKFLKQRGEKKKLEAERIELGISDRIAKDSSVSDTTSGGTKSDDRYQIPTDEAPIDISNVIDENSLRKAQNESLSSLEKTKLEWTGLNVNKDDGNNEDKSKSTDVNSSEFNMKAAADVNGQRFDLNGWPIVIFKKRTNTNNKENNEEEGSKEDDEEIPYNLGLHHHGLSPETAGYTIDELCLLCRSLNPSQRLIAIKSLSKAINNIRIIFSHLSSCHAQLQQIGQKFTSSVDDASVGLETLDDTSLTQMHNFAKWMSSLKPLRLPVQLPSLACDLLSDSSIAVRGEACILACALANENHSAMSNVDNVNRINNSDTNDVNFETWRSHIGVSCSLLSPFRRLVTGKAMLSKHASDNLREVFWDPIRREEEEKDDKEDEQHKLISIFEERVDFMLGGDEEDDNDANSIKIGSERWKELINSPSSLSKDLGEMFSSDEVLKITALKQPFKSLLFYENDENEEIQQHESNDIEEDDNSGNNKKYIKSYALASRNLIHQGFAGRCVFAVITPGLTSSAVEAGLECLGAIASMSKLSAEKLATMPSFIRVLKERFLTPQGKHGSEGELWWWHASCVLKLFRIMASMSREVCLVLAQDGTLEMIKSFLAMSPPTSSLNGQTSTERQHQHQLEVESLNKKRLSGVVLEVLRMWRVSLSYGIDLESLPTLLQIAPPPSPSPSHHNTAILDDDDGPLPCQTNSFFNSNVFLSTIATSLPLCARFQHIFGGDEGTEGGIVDSLCSALLYALEEGINAWHCHSINQKNKSVNGDEVDEVTKAALLDLGLEKNLSASSRDIIVNDYLLDMCGNTLINIGESARQCFLSYTTGNEDFDIFLSNEQEIQANLSSLRTGSALSSFLATLTFIGRKRSKMHKLELDKQKKLFPTSQNAFFVPPPPPSESNVESLSALDGCDTILDRNRQKLAVAKFLISTTNQLLPRHLTNSSIEDIKNNVKDPLSRARAITYLILKEYNKTQIQSEMDIKLMNSMTCALRLYSCVHQNNNDDDDDDISVTFAQVQKLVSERIDMFVKSMYQSNMSGQSEVKRVDLTPLDYRYGHTGLALITWRRRSCLKKLLISSSQALFQSNINKSNNRLNSLESKKINEIAIEWLAFAIPLFESGEEIDAKLCIEKYLKLRPSLSIDQIKVDENVFHKLSEAYTSSLESFCGDNFHAIQLSGDFDENDKLESTFVLKSSLSRASLVLLPHGNLFLISIQSLVSNCLYNFANRQFILLQSGKVSFQNENGEEDEENEKNIIDVSLLPALNIVLPLPKHWLALPLNIKISEHLSDCLKIVNYDDVNVTKLLKQENEKHNLIKMSIYILESFFNSTSDLYSTDIIYPSNHISLISPALLLFLLTKHIMYGEYKGIEGQSTFSQPENSEVYLTRLFNLFHNIMSKCLNSKVSFGNQLLSNVLSISPPSAMDRIEALASKLISLPPSSQEEGFQQDTDMKSSVLAPYTDTMHQPLPNRTLEKLVRVIIQQFAQFPPPISTSHHSSGFSLSILLKCLLREMLRCDVPANTRAVIWNDLAQLQVLHLLAEDWTTNRYLESNNLIEAEEQFLSPIDQDSHLLSAYVNGIISMSNRSFYLHKSPENNNNMKMEKSNAPEHSEKHSFSRLSFLWVIALNHLFGKIEHKEKKDQNIMMWSWGEKKRLTELLTMVGVESLISLFREWFVYLGDNNVKNAQIKNKIKLLLEDIKMERQDLVNVCEALSHGLL